MKNTENCQPKRHNINLTEFTEFWLSWNNGVYLLGLCGEMEPLHTYADDHHKPERLIGFVTFYASPKHHWICEGNPYFLLAIFINLD